MTAAEIGQITDHAALIMLEFTLAFALIGGLIGWLWCAYRFHRRYVAIARPHVGMRQHPAVLTRVIHHTTRSGT